MKGPIKSILSNISGKLLYYKVEEDGQIIFQIKGLPIQSIVNGRFGPPKIPTSFLGKSFAATGRDLSSLKLFKARRDDVIISTFPRSGTTWMQNICLHLVTERDNNILIWRQSPQIELIGAEIIEPNYSSPRVLKSHLPPSEFPSLEIGKFIFVLRNPKDCFASYYKFIKQQTYYDCYEAKFEDIFEILINGESEYGDYFDHLNQFLEMDGRENCLLIKYEDLRHDLRETIKKIGLFLDGVAKDRVLDEERLKSIVESSTVHKMMDNVGEDRDQYVWKNREKSVTNCGRWIDGKQLDWRKTFTKEQSDRVDQKFAERMKGTEAENWWKEEMKWENE